MSILTNWSRLMQYALWSKWKIFFLFLYLKIGSTLSLASSQCLRKFHVSGFPFRTNRPLKKRDKISQYSAMKANNCSAHSQTENLLRCTGCSPPLSVQLKNGGIASLCLRSVALTCATSICWISAHNVAILAFPFFVWEISNQMANKRTILW